jgi:hypothetical protein
VSIVGGADFSPADPVVNHFLLVFEVTQIGANYWTELLFD